MPVSSYRLKLVRRAALVGLVALLATPSFGQDVETDDETVIATVNGAPITKADLSLAESDLDAQFSRLPQEQRRAAALSALIEITLLASQAEEAGLADEPDFVRRMDFLRQRALHSAFVEKEVAGQVTDESIRSRYDQEIANTPPTNEVRARHILVETRDEAEALIEQLEEGADFEALAKEHSSDPGSGAQGGDLGYFGPGRMVPEFETAALAMEVGAHSSEPVETQFGFHVIKVEDKRTQQPPAFDQVKDQIRSMVLRDNYVELAKTLREQAEITVEDPELQSAVEQLENLQ